MDVRILGPLEVHGAGGLLTLGGTQQRAVLAMLVLHLDEVVFTEFLVDGLWGDRPPATAVNIVQVYVSRLRKALQAGQEPGWAGTAVLRRRGPGYVLELDPEQLDLHRFERLAREGARELRSAPAQAASTLREALDLWRGQPLAEFADEPFAQAEIPRLEQQRLTALEARLEADLALGRHVEAVGELQALVARLPLHEGLQGLLMLSLYRSGRQAESLAVYQRMRRRLADELGVDPGGPLKQLHQRILRADPTLTPTATATATATAGGPSAPEEGRVPRQLPAPVRHFTGRTAELAALDALLVEATAAGAPVVISAIAGTAGTGKTTLAVYWAHRIADRFPDGQLYVNLRGFDPGGQPMAPAEAVRGFLDALAVRPEHLPVDLDAQAALYRSRLAGKKMLIVLDNARDTAQVRPLLPGTPGCLVLVTSRNQLTGLIACAGAQLLTLDLFTHVEAEALLSRRFGPARIAAEPQATREIITLCARLPLALTLVAARAAAQPTFPLATLAGELRDAHARLDALAGQDGPAADVRSVFSWSYRQLSDPAARLFRLLGRHPGPHVTAAAAASLAGLPLSQVRPLLAELTGAHLLAEPTPGRYAYHDLLRAYATEQAHAVDTEADRHTAIHRLLDHYLHTGHAATRLLCWINVPIDLPRQQPGVTLVDLSDAGEALAWFDAEHPVLLAAIDQAAFAGLDTHAWLLAWSIETFLDWRVHWHDWVAVGRTALAAGRRLADPLPQAVAHRSLAGAYTQLGAHDKAADHTRQALDLFEELDDRVGQAHTHLNFTQALEQQGCIAEALHHAGQALQLFRSVGQREGQARALNAVGWFHALLGDHREALTHCEQALTLLRELGERIGEAATWDSLGLAHSHLGHHVEALDCYRQAVELFQELGAHYYEASSLTDLGDAQHTAGHTEAARDAWQQALTILDQLSHPDAEAVRAKLHNFDNFHPGPSDSPGRQSPKPQPRPAATSSSPAACPTPSGTPAASRAG
jgi:DNA-binding SARP family transcriptional activator